VKKHDLFVKEAEKGLKRGGRFQRLPKGAEEEEYIYVSCNDYFKPLMEIIWSPLFAAFSIVLEQSDEIGLLV
jgi:hypothetical protein